MWATCIDVWIWIETETSYIATIVNCTCKMLMKSTPGPNVIKVFTSDNSLVFVISLSVCPYQVLNLSIMFEDKAGRLPKKELLKVAPLR